jgi:hypothetical protein
MASANVTHVAECPDLGPECNEKPPPIPYKHHVEMFAAELALDATFGILPWLAAELRFPLRITKVTPSYRELDGREKDVPDDIHHHDVTLFGPGDPWLMMRAGASRGGFVTGARLGVTLPLGKTRPDPYELGRRGHSHEHIQFGAGTLMPIVGAMISYRYDRVSARSPLSGVELALSGLGLFSFYENHHGFRAPSRLFGSLRVTPLFLRGRLRPFVTADVTHETNERWRGKVGDEGPNERTDLLVGGGVSWRFYREWGVDFGFRVRAAKLAGGTTLHYPGVMEVGVSTSFDLLSPSSN